MVTVCLLSSVCGSYKYCTNIIIITASPMSPFAAIYYHSNSIVNSIVARCIGVSRRDTLSAGRKNVILGYRLTASTQTACCKRNLSTLGTKYASQHVNHDAAFGAEDMTSPIIPGCIDLIDIPIILTYSCKPRTKSAVFEQKKTLRTCVPRVKVRLSTKFIESLHLITRVSNSTPNLSIRPILVVVCGN